MVVKRWQVSGFGLQVLVVYPYPSGFAAGGLASPAWRGRRGVAGGNEAEGVGTGERIADGRSSTLPLTPSRQREGGIRRRRLG